MLVEMLLNGIKGFISFLLGLMNIPPMPEQIIIVLDTIKGYMIDGIAILSVFVDMRVVLVIAPLVLLVVGVKMGYRIVIWILKKIPFVGME